MSILLHGDCNDLMSEVDDDSVDLIFTDLPYGQVSCDWDKKIDLVKMWEHFLRVKKVHTPIFFCCSTKFGVELINSAPKKCPFRYDIVWVKSAPVGFLCARKMPMKKHEMLYVFYEHLPFYDLSSHTHKFIKEVPTKLAGVDGGNDGMIKNRSKSGMETQTKYEPPLPTSVMKEPEPQVFNRAPVSLKNSDIFGKDLKITTHYEDENGKRLHIEGSHYDPPLPTSVQKETCYGEVDTNEFERPNGERTRKDKTSSYEPPLPTSVQKLEPEPEPDVKRDIYGRNHVEDEGKRGTWDPPLPTSVIKGDNLYSKTELYRAPSGMYQPPLPTSVQKECDKPERQTLYGDMKIFEPKRRGEPRYEPPLPTSVQKDTCYGEIDPVEFDIPRKDRTSQYDPPLPTSVQKDECDTIYNNKGKSTTPLDKHPLTGSGKTNAVPRYDPPLPTSVLKVKENGKDKNYGVERMYYYDEHGKKLDGSDGSSTKYIPPLPTSVQKETMPVCLYGDLPKTGEGADAHSTQYDPPLPTSILEVKSQRGKHSTQKPTNLMKWVLKYYTKEDDVVLDPTMGSGSTGVACKEMNRNFIGIEMDGEIFEVAVNRIED